MNWKNILSKNKDHILRIFACIVVVLVFATLVTPAFSIDDKTADEEPGLDTQETATTEEEKSVNELENVADPFVIEAQREEAYNNAQAETEEKDIPSDTVVSEEETIDTDEQAEVTDVVSATPEEEKVEEDEEDDVITFFDDSTDITVYIEAPYDAFPEGTYMVVTPVESEEIIDAVNDALDSSNVKRVEAVDITFYDLDDNEVEPSKEIKVSLKSKLIKQSEDAKVVHIDNNGDGKLMDLHEDSDDDEVKFSADGFSTYVVVVETEVITAEGETYTISIAYDDSANFPSSLKLEAEELSGEGYETYKKTIEEELGTELNYVRLFDISIIDKETGNKVQPDDSVKVTIRLDDLDEEKQMKAIHLPEEGDMEVIDDVKVKTVDIEEDKTVTDVTFNAKGFSIYAVIDDGETGDVARRFLDFYNGESQIASMIAKTSDTDTDLDHIIYDPGIGTDPDQNVNGYLFRGWKMVQADEEGHYDGSYSVDDLDSAMSIEDIRHWAKENLSTIEEGDHVRFYAMFFKSYQVSYKDNEVSLETANNLLVPNDSSSENEYIDYNVYYSYVPEDEDDILDGWIVTKGKDNIENVDQYKVQIGGVDVYKIPNGETIRIKGDVDLSVDVAKGHWLVFESQLSGATYCAPQFVKSGEVTQQPRPDSEMKCLGYRFDGWYKDQEYTQPFTFGGEIDDRTVLYAKWIMNPNANYTVIIWKENVTATDYDFQEAITLSGASGTTVNTVVSQGTGDNRYARINGVNKQYEGFYLDHFDENVEITPEGNAILNVYYDRIEYTLRFFYARSYRSNNRTYIQVNCNNEGFLQGRRYGRNLNSSLTYRGNNDYQLLDGSNTWKDVNNNSVSGNALNLVSNDYLNKEEVTSGSININNVRTDVVTANGGSSVADANMTYYYLDVAVRYGQSLDDLWPVPNASFNAQTMTSYNRSNGNYTTIRPLLQGSWATGNNISGKYSTMNPELFVGNDKTAYFLTYWRYENYYTYQYNVYFSNLEHETGGVTYKGKQYTLQSDKSYTVANGQGWSDSGAPTDSGRGYWDVGTVTFDGTDVVGRVDVNNGVINVYYDRQEFNIDYYDGIYVDGNGNEIKNNSDSLIDYVTVLYDEDLSSYNKGGEDYFTPPEKDGYIFEGWYLDKQGVRPYTFTRMPQSDIKVYAKWRRVEYRVFLHANTDDSTLYWGSSTQKMSFRVSYDDKISAPTGTRDTGYEFIGWYKDAGLTQGFNSADTKLTEQTVTEDYDQTAVYTDPMDKFGNITDESSAYNSDYNENRTWITKQLNLYAKWRKVIDGAEGINVVYDINVAGGGKAGQTVPEDRTLYLDNSSAVAQQATLPEDQENMRFMYWMVQKYNEETSEYDDTETYVYPGDTFTVYLDDAKVEEIPEGEATSDVYLKYTVQLKAIYGEKDAPTPTHIYWYSNYGQTPSMITQNLTQDGDTVEAMPINLGVVIKPADTFTKSGYEFIGWARMPEEDADGKKVTEEGGITIDGINYKYVDGIYYVNNKPLTANDLYLTYTEGKFYRGENEVNYVAADEKMPYHGMFAVWRSLPEIRLLKKDSTSSDDNPVYLAGAEFTLELSTDSSQSRNRTSTATEAGVLFGGMIDGNWILTETKSPDGYIITDGSRKMISVENGVISLYDTTLDKDPTVTDHDVYILTIVNTPGAELPATGSSGTLLLTLVGMTLMLSSALMYLFGMRRNSKHMKERRVN